MFQENLQILQKKSPRLYQMAKNTELKNFSVETGKGVYKYIESRNRLNFTRIHSIYNPVHEAKQLIKKYESEINAHDFIFIFGIGLGYHIQTLKEAYPNKVIYAYEPSFEIFSCFLQEGSLADIKEIFVGSVEENIKYFSEKLFKKKLCILSLPFYEEVFSKEYQTFLTKYKEFLRSRMHNTIITSSYQTVWIGNTLLNFEKTFKTPYFLNKKAKEYFQDKSVLIVSAGPSLDFEIENLKKIKEEGTAYIFAVGSAINALINHGIHPDALFSFDPTHKNLENVVQPLIDRNISNIPLIYGTTIGYSVLKNFLGKMSHFHINRGGLSAYLFGTKTQDIIYDAPTVAAILLQVLLKLKTKNIIFVGQNLAILNNNTYADKIKQYEELNKKKQEKQYQKVESVFGEELETDQAFLMMKATIEQYVVASQRTDIINTTIDGARIKNTIFMRLSDVMQKKLTERVVEPNWFEQVVELSFDDQEEKHRFEVVSKNYKNLLKAQKVFVKKTKNIEECLNKIGKALNQDRMQRVRNLFAVYDDHMKKVEKNPYYTLVIMPVLEVILQRESDRAKELFEKDLTDKQLEMEKWKLLIKVIRLITQVHELIKDDLQNTVGVFLEKQALKYEGATENKEVKFS